MVESKAFSTCHRSHTPLNDTTTSQWSTLLQRPGILRDYSVSPHSLNPLKLIQEGVEEAVAFLQLGKV